MIIKDVMKEINTNKNLEANLPSYYNEMMTIHNSYAYIAMTFHYYTFEEMLLENDYSKINGFEEAVHEVSNIIKETLQSMNEIKIQQKNIETLDNLRKSIIKKMKVLTAYTDVFQVYEYILNRMELRFGTECAKVDDEQVANEIMQYIFSDQDMANVNVRISDVIGQLPVRMTKSRFLDLIRDTLSIYKGSDKSAVDTYLYMLRTSAMLDRPEGIESEFPTITRLCEVFETAEFKELDQNGYEHLKATLEDATELLELTAGAYYTLQEVINDLYTILLTTPYANMQGTTEAFVKDVFRCQEVIRELNELYFTSDVKEIPEELAMKLISFEGRQETLVEMKGALESIFYDVKLNHSVLIQSLMLEKICNNIELSLKLQSNSIFVELDREAYQGEADEVFIKRTEKELIEEFQTFFQNHPQVVCRAVMAGALSKMPVFFNNQDEVKAYITSSLNNCRDLSEKITSIQLIREIMC